MSQQFRNDTVILQCSGRVYLFRQHQTKRDSMTWRDWKYFVEIITPFDVGLQIISRSVSILI
jgi:hypothetical protein